MFVQYYYGFGVFKSGFPEHHPIVGQEQCPDRKCDNPLRGQRSNTLARGCHEGWPKVCIFKDASLRTLIICMDA